LGTLIGDTIPIHLFFADYLYSVPFNRDYPYLLPGKKNGNWTYIDTRGRFIDREKFEDFKSRFYVLEGWDPSTGYPKRNTLESLDLGYITDELESQNKMGKE